MDKNNALRRMLAELTSVMPSAPTIQEKRVQIFEKMKRDIAECGFFVMAVFPSETSPGFAYTIGLTESANHPELLVFGLPAQFAHVVLSDMVARIKNGAAYQDGALIDDVMSLPVAVKAISNEKAAEYTVQLFNYYDGKATPAVMQIALPDTHGRFPWAEGFEERFRNMQPPLWNAIH